MRQILLIGALALFVGAGCASTQEAQQEENTQGNNATASVEIPYDPDLIEAELAQIGDVYTFEDGEATYTAQKEFLSKPTEAITGTTSDVSGSMSINTESKTARVNATITTTFDTGSGTRDKEVREWLGDTITIEGNSIAVPDAFFADETVGFSTDLRLTMNGVTQSVPFSISASM